MSLRESWINSGFTNEETWSVSAHLNNNADIYDEMIQFLHTYNGDHPYLDFIASCPLVSGALAFTSDGISLKDPKVNVYELNEMMDELVYDYDFQAEAAYEMYRDSQNELTQ